MQPHYSTPIPPPPPKRPSRMWILWTSVGVFLVGLVLLFVFVAMKVKRKFDKAVKPLVDQAQMMLDSLGKTDNSHLYLELDSMLGDDSVSLAIRGKLDSLEAETNALCAAFDNSKTEFHDTLHREHASGLDKSISHAFFIRTGRAHTLHRLLIEYKRHAFAQLPPEQRDSSYLAVDPLDAMQRSVPGFMKKMLNWETMYFDQPCQSVMTNFNTIHIEIRAYEKRLIEAYRSCIYAHDIHPKADTVH